MAKEGFILNKNKLVMTSGEQMMDIVYVTDVVKAYMIGINYILNVKNTCSDEIFFVSSGEQIKLKSLVEKYLKINRTRLDIDWGGKPHRAREIMHPLKNVPVLPGWSPKVNLDEGLKLIANLD